MLKKYRISNFKSFRSITEIDLTSTNSKILSNRNVTDNNILKGLMFVGANASGKTNAILAVKILFDLLFSESLANLNRYFCMFSDDRSIILEYEFDINNEKIDYYIEYDMSKKILIEKLLLKNVQILDRIGNNALSSITDNTKFNDLDNDVLLLREIYFNTKFRGNDTLREWFEFLSNSAYIDLYGRRVVSPGKFSLNLDEYLKKSGVDTFNEFFTKYNFNQRVEYSDQSKGKKIRIETDGENLIFFKREGIEEPIPYPYESLGNQNLLIMLPAFFHVVTYGGILLVDEFSSGFHNELEELLIKYFMKMSNRAQILFVSHSTNLISNTILRPDQIYSVNFMGSEGSVLKRFSSEKPREAQNLEKMYNSGVFDGLPNYKEEI